MMNQDTYHINTPSLQHTLGNASDFKGLFQLLIDRLDVTLIMHVRRYNDGTVFYLCNNPDLINFFFTNRCYNYSQGERHPSVYQKGFTLWDSWQPDKNDINEYLHITKPLKEEYNAAHGIMVFQPQKDFCDIYSIASARDNTNANINFMTKYNLILREINDYHERASTLIKNAHLLRHKNHYDIAMNPFEDKSNNKIITDHEKFNGSSISLEKISKREIECMYWLTKGMTAAQLAKKCFLSRRSVEIYIAKLKQKLNCKNICQLGYFIGAYKHHFDVLFDEIDNCRVAKPVPST